MGEVFGEVAAGDGKDGGRKGMILGEVGLRGERCERLCEGGVVDEGEEWKCSSVGGIGEGRRI